MERETETRRHGISQFPGLKEHSEAFANWKEEIENFASIFTEASHPAYGLLWAVITPAEWLTLPGIVAVYVRHVAPAQPRPGGAVNGPAWDLMMELYNEETRAEQKVRSALMATCDEMGKHAMKGGLQLRAVTLETAMNNLVAEWGAPKESDLARATALCERQYVPPGAIDKFFLVHLNAHALMARANQPMPEFFKLKFIIGAMTPCGHFHDCIMRFQQSYPENDPGRTFAAFKTAALLFASRFPISATTGSMGYAGGAKTMNWQEARIEELERQVAALAAGQPRTQRAEKAQVAPESSRIGTGEMYCWTHGVPRNTRNGHHSRDCKYPATGHQRNATMRDKMGGKEA